MEFMAWPSIARLNREIIVTEKIDGTNAAVIIESLGMYSPEGAMQVVSDHTDEYVTHVLMPAPVRGTFEVLEVGAQSRKRLISPLDDNFGFATWVHGNATELVQALGEGRHYGEWWGSGVQRGYGLSKGEKRFSLFNVKRWEDVDFRDYGLPNVACVPVLYRGPFSQGVINGLVEELRSQGSLAAFGFDRPEGVVVYHTAANTLFKVTLENDEVPKSVASKQTVNA